MSSYKKMQIVLASSSPRRKKFLTDLGLCFTASPVNIDERVFPDELPESYVARVAFAKFSAAVRKFPDCPVLAADTTVYQGAEIFGKPEDERDALRMLQSLRGKRHNVATSFVFGKNSCYDQQTVITEVVFDVCSDRELLRYISTGEPLDKAGAYGIQGQGAFLVRALYGSYTNVVGLPLAEVRNILMKYGFVL